MLTEQEIETLLQEIALMADNEEKKQKLQKLQEALDEIAKEKAAADAALLSSTGPDIQPPESTAAAVTKKVAESAVATPSIETVASAATPIVVAQIGANGANNIFSTDKSLKEIEAAFNEIKNGLPEKDLEGCSFASHNIENADALAKLEEETPGISESLRKAGVAPPCNVIIVNFSSEQAMNDFIGRIGAVRLHLPSSAPVQEARESAQLKSTKKTEAPSTTPSTAPRPSPSPQGATAGG